MRSVAAEFSVSEAVGEALDFTRDAWRDAYAPMILCILGWTAICVAGHGDFLDRDAALFRRVGIGLLVFALPLSGALFRAGVGGRALASLGPGGLQLTRIEGLLLVIAGVLAAGLVVCAAPLVGVSGLLFLALRRFGVVTLGPLGGWAVWFLAAAVVCAAGLGVVAYGLARLSMLSPIAAAQRRLRPRLSWRMTRNAVPPLIGAWLVVHIPTVLALLADKAVGWIATDNLGGGHMPWPPPEAAGLGLLTGLLYFAVQAPLSVGLASFAYDVLREDVSDPAVEMAPAVCPLPEPAATPEPLDAVASGAAAEASLVTPLLGEPSAEGELRPTTDDDPPAPPETLTVGEAAPEELPPPSAGDGEVAGDDHGESADEQPSLFPEDHAAAAAEKTPGDPVAKEAMIEEPAAERRDAIPPPAPFADDGVEQSLADHRVTESDAPAPIIAADALGEAPAGEDASTALAPEPSAAYMPKADADRADDADSALEPARP